MTASPTGSATAATTMTPVSPVSPLKARGKGEGHLRGRGRALTARSVAALGFLLVIASLCPTLAAAAPNGTIEVTIEGTGGGEVSSVGGLVGTGIWEGTPPIACAYASPGPATGTCEGEMEQEEEGEGNYGSALRAIPAPGSVFVGWVVEGAEEEPGCGSPSGKSCFPNTAAAETEIKVKAVFDTKPVPPNGTITVTIEGTGGGEVSSVGGLVGTGIWEGTPPIACAYASPGPATGTCEGEMEQEEEGEGNYGSALRAIPAPGSVFVGWVVEGAEEEPGCGSPSGKSCFPNTAAAETEIKVKAVFDQVPPPAITGVSPDEGPAVGGQTVTITGTNLTGASKVEFGTTAVTCPQPSAPGRCVIKSATEIEVETPAHTAEQVDVTLTTAGGTSPTSPADEYTYVQAPAIAEVSPAEGPTAGGNVVAIHGTDLQGASKVQFDQSAVPAAKFISASDTLIELKAPQHSAGTVAAKVTTVGGASSDQYTYIAQPAVTSLSPAKGPTSGGNTVQINGLRLSGASKVDFGQSSVQCPSTACVLESATLIKVKAPPGALGTVNVRVTSTGGASGNFPEDDYTYVAPASSEGDSGTTTPPVAQKPLPPPPEPQKCVVPRLAQKTLAQAKSSLKAAHCGLGKVTKPKKAKGPLLVRSSAPGAGKTLDAGTKVDVGLAPKKNKGRK